MKPPEERNNHLTGKKNYNRKGRRKVGNKNLMVPCVCAYVWLLTLFIFRNINIFEYTYTIYKDIFTYTHICIYVYMCIYECMHVHVYTHTYIYTYTHLHIYIYI